MTDGTTASTETMQGAYHGCGVKKRWSPWEIGAVVGGFIVFWPLGLLALGLKMWKGEIWNGASEMKAPWKDFKKPEKYGFAKEWQTHRGSGNSAFDDYKKAQLERLEAERRKLDDEQRAFGEYLAKLRKAKDQDEFDRFMRERNPVDNPNS
jgi:Protein of unknown function (DUF2852)